MDSYYDDIATGYNELHREEQEKKIAFIKELVTFDPTWKLLDVGCGTGLSTVCWGSNATGIDPSAGLLKIARHDFPEVQFTQASGEELPFRDKSFDVVVSLTALQNFIDVRDGLKEIQRVCRGGIVLSFLASSAERSKIEREILLRWPQAKRFDQGKDIVFINGLT